MSPPARKIPALSLFAVAMAFAETAVVVYLRKLYYPSGFSFPLAAVPPDMVSVEAARELSTLVMLGCAAWIAGRKFHVRVAYFLYAFALWDIFYYIFLKIVLGWPPSFLTWDLLFLIPAAWASPVIAPVICSVTMIIMSALLFEAENRAGAGMNSRECILVLMGAFTIFISFIRDYAALIISGGFWKSYFALPHSTQFMKAACSYKPAVFGWGIFLFGEALILAGLVLFRIRNFSGGNKPVS